jgi:hypothetical protein
MYKEIVFRCQRTLKRGEKNMKELNRKSIFVIAFIVLTIGFAVVPFAKGVGYSDFREGDIVYIDVTPGVSPFGHCGMVRARITHFRRW